MHLNIATMLVSMCVATGVVAQNSASEDQSPQPGTRHELQQISRVIDPADFNLIERVQWGARLFFAPASFSAKVPLYVYNPNEGFDCNSSTGGALVDKNYRVTRLEWQTKDEIKFNSWASLDDYCDSSEEIHGLEIPHDILREIVNSLDFEPQQALISIGPITGGEPVTTLWADCNLKKVWAGSPCADRLGWSESASPPLNSGQSQ